MAPERVLSTGGEASRRRILHITGTAGAAALAGCAGGSDDEADDTGGEITGDEPMTERTFTAPTSVLPDDMQWNAANDSNYPDRPGFVVFDQLVYFRATTGEFAEGALADWEVGDDAATLTLQDDLTWHNGEDATAEDLVRKLHISLYDNHPIGNFTSVENVEAVDDTTVEVGLEADVSEPVFLNSIQNMELDTPAEQYQDILEELENDPESTALADFAPEEPIGTGPFQYDSSGEQELVTTKFEDSHWADDVNFAEYRFRFIDGNEQAWQALRGGSVDALHNIFTSPDIMASFPDHVVEIQQPANWGLSIAFDHDHKHFGQREVRKAIAHVVDREVVAENSAGGGDAKAPVGTPTGIVGNFDDSAAEWLDDPDAFEDYAGNNTERATELLESAGFSREDGTWVDADGETLTFEFKVPAAWNEWVDAAITINQHLQDFGVQTNLVTRDDGVYFGQDLYGDTGFDIAGFWWSDGWTYPYHTLNWNLNSADAKNVYNYSESIELPPIGDPDGETETLEFAPEFEELVGMDQDAEETRQKINELAWAFNYDLPQLPIQEKVDQCFVATENFSVVDDSDPDASVKYPTTYLPRIGKLVAKEE
ncbi:ABC transporter substrate-binding protein [Halopiger xanaduensis]|uniref:ABC-type transporter, periplasmic subunit n=1 Tax=Halopiger xanaduensis (strain DSM 18323 / JCM 14033 / SH-6) TaxID=797210 RepID=F8DD85_HALXS|nr:ABC transporter substrate-binding protein [Halopiger xanaduensis]AEH38974.1 ABC-type transporter, periplasmic subunit [Halopiger xanaduensis SH-6]